jgi:large subunit ribosomal protein L18
MAKSKALSKRLSRLARKERIRRKISGSAERPRLTVFKSLKHMYVQLIDDESGKTLAHITTQKTQEKLSGTSQAKFVGQGIAKKALSLNIKNVVFDRSGYPYHGTIKALAESAREAGLIF